MPDIPRPEYPRPQLRRDTWVNLNGVWTCRFDNGKSGREQNWQSAQGFDRDINVPFCPESVLSGIGHTDFIEAIWYHRTIEIPADWAGQRVLLHFGAVDYEAEIYIDGKSAARHWGGSVSFTVDITRFVTPGQSHHLVVRAHDDVRAGIQPSGKQSDRLKSYSCKYTRVTGIWQTVWMEAVSPFGIDGLWTVPDLDGQRFIITPRFREQKRGVTWSVRVLADGKEVGAAKNPATSGTPLSVNLSESRPWGPDNPFLYDIEFLVTDSDGTVIDVASSYAGLRKVHTEGNVFFLNNKPVFQRLVLDQGYYPDGIWTAPSDEALRRDIELSMRAGFNGARLHQKVFEERFHYWADKLGYLTWGEAASWGCEASDPLGNRQFHEEWTAIVERDRNYCSIIAWTPFNESQPRENADEHHRANQEVYDLTKRLDPTRPVNENSGYVHIKTDLWTSHCYEQDPETFREMMRPDANGEPYRSKPDLETDYTGQPYFCDEFGGIKWVRPEDRKDGDSWGYGKAPKDLDEFYSRLEGLVRALLQPHMQGYCYTQLTDVEQEQNGIYTYGREEKFDMDRVSAIFKLEP